MLCDQPITISRFHIDTVVLYKLQHKLSDSAQTVPIKYAYCTGASGSENCKLCELWSNTGLLTFQKNPICCVYWLSEAVLPDKLAVSTAALPQA